MYWSSTGMGFLPSEIQYQIFFGSIHPEGKEKKKSLKISALQVSKLSIREKAVNSPIWNSSTYLKLSERGTITEEPNTATYAKKLYRGGSFQSVTQKIPIYKKYTNRCLATFSQTKSWKKDHFKKVSGVIGQQ